MGKSILKGLLAIALAGGLALLAILIGMSEIETTSSTHAGYADAKARGLIDRGWIPSFLPSSARDIRESHDIDTNARCLRASVDSSDLRSLSKTLLSHGFERYADKPPAPPGLSFFRSCPFDRSESASAPFVFRRQVSTRSEFEYVALDEARSTLLFWSAAR